MLMLTCDGGIFKTTFLRGTSWYHPYQGIPGYPSMQAHAHAPALSAAHAYAREHPLAHLLAHEHEHEHEHELRNVYSHYLFFKNRE